MSGQRNGLRGDRLDRADEGGFARMDKARAPGRADGLVQRKASREVEAPTLEGRRGLTIDAFSVADTAPAVQLQAFDSAVARTHEAVAEADGGLFGGRSGRSLRTAFDGAASADTFDLMGGARSSPVQMKTDGHTGRDTDDIQSAAAHGTRGGGGKLPYFERIQAAFGNHDISGIRSHVGGAAREASDAIGAEAYATGSSVAFRSAPSLHTAAHEAAHIVQQRAGVSLKGGVGESGDRYERHADAVADAVVSGKSAEGLLGPVRSGGLAGLQRAAKQGQGSQQNDGGGDLTETVTAEDLAKAEGIEVNRGPFAGASSPTGVGLRNITANVASNHAAVKVKMNRQTAEEAAKKLSGSLKKMAFEALNGLVNGGNGMSASVTFNVPLPWTSGLGMVGLTLGGGFSKVNQQTYKCSLIGQVTALAKAGTIVEVYAKIFGSLAVEAEGPLGEMPGLLEGALWKSLGTCLDMAKLKSSAGFYIQKSNDALANKQGKTKAIQGVGFEAGLENRANASKAAASMSGEKSQEFENDRWKESDAHAVAVMGAGVTGGYKWTEGKNGNGKKSLELCVQADKAGMKNVNKFLSRSLRGFFQAKPQFPIEPALRELAPLIGAAANANSPLFQSDSQAKIELKAECQGNKWTYAAALTYVKIQKFSDDKNPGFSAQLGFEKKVGGT